MMIRAFLRYCPDTASKCATAYFKISTLLSKGASTYHTIPVSVQLKDMRIKIIPALKDNYMYLIVDENTNEAAAVDPVEPSKILKAVNEEKATLTTVLTTHHHWDHAGGNKELLKLCPGLNVVGGDDRIDGLTTKVVHNDKVSVGDLTVQCLSTPCHTKGHVCYYIKLQNKPSVVFTGDTLFTAGCGRFFEGTASEMYRALIQVLGTLPDDTQVYSGHEYALNNLNFARHVEPQNPYISRRLEWALSQREKNYPTVPSTIGEEKRSNPFMRVCETEIQQILGKNDPVSAMGDLRKRKDGFS